MSEGRPKPTWTVATLSAYLYERGGDWDNDLIARKESERMASEILGVAEHDGDEVVGVDVMEPLKCPTCGREVESRGWPE